MKKPLEFCCNGDGRPVQPPSWVLCKECLAELDAQFRAIGAKMGVTMKQVESRKADAS